MGKSKPLKRIVVHWSAKAESQWPGILYVGNSRAMEADDIAIHDALSLEDLRKVGSQATWAKQHEEVDRLLTLAEGLRRKLRAESTKPWHPTSVSLNEAYDEEGDRRYGSKFDFIQRLYWFTSVMATRIRDLDRPQETKQEILGCLRQWNDSLDSKVAEIQQRELFEKWHEIPTFPS